MKYFFLFALSTLLFFSCQSPESTSTREVALSLPDQFSYAGKNPAFGSASELEPVIEWNKRLSELNPQVGDLFSDSVTWHWASGVEYTYSRDSLVSLVRAGLANTESLSITIAAAIPVHYADVGHLWIYRWIFEEMTYKDGSYASHYLHEDFRIENGRIREIYQFKREKASAE